MPYTTPELVAGIIEVDDGDDLNPFIRTANRLIVRFCEPYLDDGTSLAYTEDDLENIETWLAAHFYAVFRRQVRQEQAGSVSATYEGKVDLDLRVTVYGQQAIILALNGELDNLGKKVIAAGVQWLGIHDDVTPE